jgi:signal transduction histidine kinase
VYGDNPADSQGRVESSGALASELENTKALLARTQSELLQLMKKTALSSRLATTAHDLRNAIGLITSSIGVLGRHLTDMKDLLDSYGELEEQLDAASRQMLSQIKSEIRLPQIRDDSHKILKAVDDGAQRALSTLKELLSHVKGEASPHFEPCQLSDCLAQVIFPIQTRERGRVQIVTELAPIRPVFCRINHIYRLVENLVINAVQAIPATGTVRVSLVEQPDGALIRITDSGTGIPANIQSRIFDPFFSTKPPDVGTGLGLSIASDIVREHGGRISVQSQLSTGTIFEVWLPFSPPTPQES